jgi:ABC-type bacteriocin/lantibiotic exporter with double-glycine peptidase domain
MRMRSHRRNVAVWHPSDPYRAVRYTRRARARRVRWWLRAGAWLAVIGVTRLARTVQRRWPLMFLVTGVLLMVIGVMLRSTVAFIAGMLVAGSSAEGRLPSPTAAMVRMSERLHNRHADHPADQA